MNTDESQYMTTLNRLQALEKKLQNLFTHYQELDDRLDNLEESGESNSNEDLDHGAPDPDRTAFDHKLKVWAHRMPTHIQQACVNVNDSMEMSWASARQVFGEEAMPEHAFQIYDRIATAQEEYLNGNIEFYLEKNQKEEVQDNGHNDSE